MRLYCCTRVINKPNLWNKRTLLVLLLIVALIPMMIFLRPSFVPRRPKTFLIYNNESLCHSTQPLANSHNHWSITLSASETTQTSIVIVIPSSRKNFLKRNLIRQSYGAIRHINNVDVLAVVFMIGGTDEPHYPKTDVGKLEAERVQFGDIVMGDFVDTYRNLSRKSVMAYDWLTSYCQEADLVVKTDDDVVVDIFKLTDELGKWTKTMFQSLTFWGAVHHNEAIFRKNDTMYYVSYEEYAGNVFPKHCAGVGYVTSMTTIHKIASEISKSFLGTICTHEDAFLTGIVPEKINSDENGSIQHIDKRDDWILYVDENSKKIDGTYVWDMIEKPANETVDFDEFRRRTRKQVFYLLQQNDDFERKYLRLWYLLENSFRKGDNKN